MDLSPAANRLLPGEDLFNRNAPAGYWRIVAASRWLPSLLVTASCLAYFLYASQRPTLPPIIRGDGSGYHLWTRGLLTLDFRFCSWRQLVPDYVFAREDLGRGVCQIKYPPGVAFIQLPMVAIVLRHLRSAQTITPTEHWAVLAVSSLLLIAICMLITSTCERLGLRRQAIVTSVLTFSFGTGLFLYATYWASYSHIYAAFAFALLIWALARLLVPAPGSRTAKQHQDCGKAASADHKQTEADWRVGLVTGVASFLVVLTRNVNVLALALLLGAYAMACTRRSSWRRTAKDLLPALCGIAAGAALQLGYNWYAAGHFSFSSYGGERFQVAWSQPAEVALSYDRGLIPTYPVVALAVLLGLLVRPTFRWAFGFLVLLSVYLFVYGFWHMPGLGWSFGPRGLVDFMPIGMLLFAAALSCAGRNARKAATVAAFVCTFFTMELAAAHVRNRLAPELITPGMYWDAVSGKGLFRHFPGK